MYVPKLYQDNDMGRVREFIASHSFATLVGHDGGRPVATHVPVALEERAEGFVVTWHLSNANPHLKFLLNGQESLMIFTGEHGYISSDWYDHENVPTWNYVVVHVYGQAQKLSDEALREHLRMLIRQNETSIGGSFDFDKMTPSMVNHEIRGITGFEMKPAEIQSARKLSQNRDDKNHHSIIDHLEKLGDPSSLRLAEEMRRQRQ